MLQLQKQRPHKARSGRCSIKPYTVLLVEIAVFSSLHHPGRCCDIDFDTTVLGTSGGSIV